ncbi:MAG: hypothetical protein Q9195_006004 [Heterodermia aff. obscurata]
MTLPGGCAYHNVTNGKKWEPLRIKDLMNPPQNWISSHGCFFGAEGWDTDLNGDYSPNGTEMAASPLLAYPQDILTMDPVWVRLKCLPGPVYDFGLGDPPRVLTPVTAMGPVTTALSPHSKISNLDPAPASTPAVIPIPKTTLPTSPTITQLSPTLEPIQALPTILNSPSGKSPIVNQSPADEPDSKSSNHQSDTINTPQVIDTVGGKPVFVTPSADTSVHGTPVQKGDLGVSGGETTISIDPGTLFVGVSSDNLPSLDTGSEQAPKSVAGEILTAAQSHAIVLGGNTIEPGQQTTIDGNWVSVGQDHLIINSKTYAVPSAESSNDPLPSVGGQPIDYGSKGAIIVGSSTIYPGQHTVIGGDTISLASGKVVVKGKTYIASTSSSPSLNDPLPSVGGQSIDYGPEGAVIVGSSTIYPGQHTVIGGDTISLASDNIVVNGKTYIASASSSSPLNSPLPSVGGQPIEFGPKGAIIVDGSTIYPGQHTAVGGDTISLTLGKVVVNGKTYVIPAPSSSMLSGFPSSNIPSAIGGAVLKGSDDGGLFLGDSLIAPGQHTDIHGTHVSVGSDYMVIGSTTYSKPTAEPTTLLDAYSALASIDPAVTIAKDGAIVMGDSTISLKQQTSISGVYLSVGSGSLVVGSKTYKLPAPQPSDVEKAQSALAALAGTGNISMNPDGVIMMGDSTLTAGFQTTISGELVSIASDKLVIGISTYALSDGPKISTASNGEIVIGHYTLSKGESTIISGEAAEVNSNNVVVAGTTYPFAKPTSAEALGLIIASMFGYAQSPTPGGSHSLIAEADATSRPFVTTTTTADPIANFSLFTGSHTSSTGEKSLKVSTMVLCICLAAIALGL